MIFSFYFLQPATTRACRLFSLVYYAALCEWEYTVHKPIQDY